MIFISTEAGKSNLFDALYRVNPFDQRTTYRLDEDWPVDDWGNKGKDKNHIVCKAQFSLDANEISELYRQAGADSENTDSNEEDIEKIQKKPKLPKSLILEGRGYYNFDPHFYIEGPSKDDLDSEKIKVWASKNIPNFVCIHDYEMSGTQIELDQLKARSISNAWEDLSNEDQTILELAKINLDEFIEKGNTKEGRTTRSFDKRQASAFLTQQFRNLWRQKDVRFDIEVDDTTLNIFVEDTGVGMPVRLNRRSTGFRWYVSFAWKFTQASGGEYENCILLLEEPGVHLHYEGQQIPMYAAFSIGNKWDAGVLLDTDKAGNDAKKKIEDLYLSKAAVAGNNRFFIKQIGKAAGITKTDAAIEDLFPDEFYIECVNTSYGLAIKLENLPPDGSDMITKSVEQVLISKHGYTTLDKRRVMTEILKRFDTWTTISDLPKRTAVKAEKLFKAINASFYVESANNSTDKVKTKSA